MEAHFPEFVRGVIINACVDAHIVATCASESNVYAFPPIRNDDDTSEYRIYFSPDMDGRGDKSVLETVVEGIKASADGKVDCVWLS